MGNCCSEAEGGRSAVAVSQTNPGNGSIDAVELYLRSRGFQGLYSQIELSLAASDLRDRDDISKSDPVAVIYTKGRDGKLAELGRTEIVPNSINPIWITKHNITYHFELVQSLVFHVYVVDTQFQNVDVKMLKLDEQQFLGEATCALSEIMTKSDRSLTLDLVHREESMLPIHVGKRGTIKVHAEESGSSKITAEMVFRCLELENKDLFSKSDPFLVISKVVESGMTIPVSKTEVIKNELKPIWKSVSLNIQQIGSKGGGMHAIVTLSAIQNLEQPKFDESPLIIECFNFNSNGKHDLMGKVQKSLADLERIHFSGQGAHLLSSTSIGHDYVNKVLKSQLYVDKFTWGVQHTFLDYLAGGFELNFMIAIDFTASNGNHRLPDSLHYIDPSGRPNAYQRAVIEIGEVLQFYDSDKRFPAWGFGARPIDGPVSHCFNLNGSAHKCEVEGIQGIMMAYTSALYNVSLAGPTLFGPVISNAGLIASQSLANGGRKYFVLLIITDGVVTDLQETGEAIVKASDLPLSILIVGVGGSDFKEMEILDADKGDRLESLAGHVASREIVQFVPFREVQSGDISVVQALLAKLPSQFLTYMRTRDIKPNV